MKKKTKSTIGVVANVKYLPPHHNIRRNFQLLFVKFSAHSTETYAFMTRVEAHKVSFYYGLHILFGHCYTV